MGPAISDDIIAKFEKRAEDRKAAAAARGAAAPAGVPGMRKSAGVRSVCSLVQLCLALPLPPLQAHQFPLHELNQHAAPGPLPACK